MSESDLRQQVQQITWWHTIDLGNGVVTPGQDRTVQKLKTIRMPTSLRGWSVLDIGAADGFFSFEAERRGAGRVLAIDYPRWTLPADERWSKAGFDLAKRVLNSKVEDRTLDVRTLSPQEVGEFDLVLFLGMLYHLQDPLAVLHNVSHVTRRMLIVETLVDMLGTRRPAAAFYPELEDAPGVDASNWWGPNYAAVIAMLHAVGFRRVKVVAKRPLAHRVARAIKLRVQGGRPIRETVQQGRAVFHAWK